MIDNAEAEHYITETSKKIISKLKRAVCLEKSELDFLFTQLLKVKRSKQTAELHEDSYITEILTKIQKNKATQAEIFSVSGLIWTIVQNVYKPVPTKKLFDSVLVPRVIPIYSDEFILSRQKNTKEVSSSLQIPFTSVLISALVPINMSETKDIFTRFDIQDNKKKEDKKWTSLDLNTKILLELESIGLGNSSLKIISNDYKCTMKEINKDQIISVFEANMFRKQLHDQLLANIDKIEYDNAGCSFI